MARLHVGSLDENGGIGVTDYLSLALIVALLLLGVVWWLERSRKPHIRDCSGRSCSIALALRRRAEETRGVAAAQVFGVDQLP